MTLTVTAVIVAHDGALWLPRALAAVADQTRLPDRVLAVDTGSRDESPGLLRRSLGADQVTSTGRDTGFGDAVRRAAAARAERLDQEAQEPRHRPHREVGDDLVEADGDASSRSAPRPGRGAASGG